MKILPIALYLTGLFAVLGSFRAVAAPLPAPAQRSGTLLTAVGRLTRVVPQSESAGWERALQNGHPSRQRTAQLHLWLGEVAIARDRDPDRALQEFAQAERLTSHSNPIHGCAAFDHAVTLFFHGAYAMAASEFQSLSRPKTALYGYSGIDCFLWYRHAGACAGYHAQHARLGITEPSRLDPLCGVAALAACFRAHSRPYDKRTLLSHCRITGLGNNMEDLRQCAERLGMSAHGIKADAQGLQALPMPLVAYVEQDHFVAVTRADRDGVSYLCSDCGAWPGGRRDLTWKQWRAMECNLFLTVTEPNSPESTALNLLLPSSAQRSASLVSRPVLATLPAKPRVLPPHTLLYLLGTHIFLYDPLTTVYCGQQPGSGQEPPNTNCPKSCPAQAPGATTLQDGPASGDPVNLATGEEEYRPAPDLTVYNPIGPSVVWQRQFGSLRGLYLVPNGLFAYAQSAFGTGWNSSYDLQVIVSGSSVLLYMPNGSAYTFQASSTPTASTPQVTCTSAGGVPMLCVWNYNSDGSLSFTFTQTDRQKWIFSSRNGYALTRMVDRNGNALNFVYSTPGAAGYQLTAITDNNNSPLLTIHHNSRFNITSVTDRYGRAVLYSVKRLPNFNVPKGYAQYSDELTSVSQIVRAGTSSAPSRYQYGYKSNTNLEGAEMLPALHTITTPSPAGKGNSTLTIDYDTVYVSKITDANGNVTSYIPVDTNDTQVQVFDRTGNLVYSYTVAFDAQMRTTSRVRDGDQAQVYQATYMADNAYQPATEIDGNSHTTTYQYNAYGQVTAVTTPRNVTTTYTYDYSVFPLGELKSVQTGTKSPTTFAYYEPSGLLKAVTTPMPGTAGSAQTATSNFTYDALGNLLTATRPGNGTATKLTTTLNYTRDGAYSQPDAIGQPLTLTDNLGHITRFRYDQRGNLISASDALGNQSSLQYNLANQRTEVFTIPQSDVTVMFGVKRSPLTYNASTKTYNGTLTLTNVSNQAIQGYLLTALTNLTPGVTLANVYRNYVNSPTLLSGTVALAPSASTTLNVSFAATGPNVNYDVQVYQTNSGGTSTALSPETRSVYLYPGGPLSYIRLFDETGTLVRQIHYQYGAEGELLAVSGSTEPVIYTYDGAYRRASLTDGNGHTTQYAYNPLGYLASVTYPLGDTVQYPLYDGNGNPLQRIDGRGIETDYTYNDPESKLTNIQHVNNANYPKVSQYNVAIQYDSYGRPQDIFDYSGHTHRAYDDLDTVTGITTTYNAASSTLPPVTLTYGFYPDGSRASMELQNATAIYNFAYHYDAAGRPISLTNPFNETTQWTYLNNDWLNTQQLANGVLTQYAYNRLGYLNDLTNVSANGTLLSDFGAMTYDTVANRQTKIATVPAAPTAYSGSTAYQYDLKDQLTQEASSLASGYTNSFAYDSSGNPKVFRGTGNTFNANNQFTNTGFAYDGNGNPTTYKNTAITFDPENHMTAYGTLQTAGYTADGLRAWKNTANGTTYYLYDGITPILELNATGAVTAVNTFGPTGLLSRHTTTGSTLYTFDPQGNVSQRLAPNGPPLSTTLFDAFGNGISTTSTPDPYGYGAQWGYYTDTETNLQLLGLRHYDPALGRFLTRDPINYAGGINLYAYVGNRPQKGTDPIGWCDTSTGCGSNSSPSASTGEQVLKGSAGASGGTAWILNTIGFSGGSLFFKTIGGVGNAAYLGYALTDGTSFTYSKVFNMLSGATAIGAAITGNPLLGPLGILLGGEAYLLGHPQCIYDFVNSVYDTIDNGWGNFAIAPQMGNAYYGIDQAMHSMGNP